MKHVNSEVMKKMVKDFVKSGQQEEVIVVAPRIRQEDHHRIVTMLIQKIYRVVYDKRVVRNDFTTLCCTRGLPVSSVGPKYNK